MFRTLVTMRPMSLNAYFQAGGRKRFEERFRPWKEKIIRTFGSYSKLDAGEMKLYGRITCFNRQREGNTADIDNIFKPLFDALEGIVYEDDENIVYVEGIRLDMEEENTLFSFETRLIEDDTDITPLFDKKSSCLLIEVGQLPMQDENRLVDITWL